MGAFDDLTAAELADLADLDAEALDTITLRAAAIMRRPLAEGLLPLFAGAVLEEGPSSEWATLRLSVEDLAWLSERRAFLKAERAAEAHALEVLEDD